MCINERAKKPCRLSRQKTYKTITMKTDNDKQIFFAQYFGQKIAKNTGWADTIPPSIVDSAVLFNRSWFLQLKSLSDITDEHAFRIAQILNSDSEISSNDLREDWREVLQTNDICSISSISEYLKANGYALDWTNANGYTYTVEEMEKLGWIKLKSK